MAYHVYLSISGENRILRFKMDAETGKLEPLGEVETDGGPGPLATDPEQKVVYAGLRSSLNISSYRIDQGTGDLSLIGSVGLEADPCYLATDRKGNYLLSAYYRAGVAAVHPIGSDGAVGGPPVEWIQTSIKAHCIQTDRGNRFAFVPHVGESNAVFQFAFDETTGALTPNAVPTVPGGEGAGPRHFVFHPSQDVLYFSDEQGCSVTAYTFDSSNGTLTPFQTVSTLPEDFEGDNSCAQIHITPSGDFLYVSNRGHDSIAGFSTDRDTGRLTSLGQQPTEPTPRAFNIDLTGNFLYAGGQGSGKLASYRIDPQTGSLTPLETRDVGQSPMWVLFVNLPD